MQTRKPNFQRTKYRAYVKLGSGQKSKLKYRRAKGRHNKTRQKWRSRPPMVEIGYKNQANQRHLIEGKMPIRVFNLNDMQKVSKNNVVIIANVGEKKKIEMINFAHKNKMEVLNVNIAQFLKDMERKVKMKKENKEKSKEKVEEVKESKKVNAEAKK